MACLAPLDGTWPRPHLLQIPRGTEISGRDEIGKTLFCKDEESFPAAKEEKDHGKMESHAFLHRIERDKQPNATVPANQGDWYVITHMPLVAVRDKPSVGSTVIHGCKPGDLVELFDTDISGSWRHIKMQLKDGTETLGWLPMEHPFLGSLVQPASASEVAKHKTLANMQSEERQPVFGEDPLAHAVQQRNLWGVQHQLRCGANPARCDDVGETPIFEAISNGDIGITAALLLHSADPNVRSSSGVACAAFAQDANIITLLDLFRGLEVVPTARRDVLTNLPLGMLRPVAWALHKRGACTEAEADSDIYAIESQLFCTGPPPAPAWQTGVSPLNPPMPVGPAELLLPEPWHRRPVFRRNTSAIYVVTFRPSIAVRHMPNLSGDVIYTLNYGQSVELHEWATTGNWRQCTINFADVPKHKKMVGWVLIEHPLFGPLLESAGPDKGHGSARMQPSANLLGTELISGNMVLPDNIPTTHSKNDMEHGLQKHALDHGTKDLPNESQIAPRRSIPKDFSKLVGKLQVGGSSPSGKEHTDGSTKAAAPLVEASTPTFLDMDRKGSGASTPATDTSYESCVAASAGSESGEWFDETPLARAVRKQHFQDVLKCLKQGANPNQRDALGETALFEATANGDVGITAALLVYGGDPTLQSYAGAMCTTFAEDNPTRTILGLFQGVETDKEALAEVLAQLTPELGGVVIRRVKGLAAR